MAESIIKLTAYSILKEVYQEPKLNLLETVILQALKQGWPLNTITQRLQMDVGILVSGLKQKGVLTADLCFRYQNREDFLVNGKKEVEKMFVFFNPEQNKFYDTCLYTNEMKFDQKFILDAPLGSNFLDNALEEVYPLKCFHVSYRVQPGNALRRLSCQFTNNEYLYEER